MRTGGALQTSMCYLIAVRRCTQLGLPDREYIYILRR